MPGLRPGRFDMITRIPLAQGVAWCVAGELRTLYLQHRVAGAQHGTLAKHSVDSLVAYLYPLFHCPDVQVTPP
jgi:hypothetical protein